MKKKKKDLNEQLKEINAIVDDLSIMIMKHQKQLKSLEKEGWIQDRQISQLEAHLQGILGSINDG